MRRRAELVDETRQRIVEATVRLHTSVGPAHTSIASIADEAGVTRLTVYRHFADLDVLFEACHGHWRSQNPPPDARAWAAITDLEERARHAFAELYGWFRDHADDLFPIARDATSMPISAQRAREAENRQLGDLLVVGHAADDADGRSLQAVARHLVDYSTWRSLAVEQGLGNRDAVDVAVRLLMSMVASGHQARRGTARPRRTSPAPSR